jgi:hypothetical protein
MLGCIAFAALSAYLFVMWATTGFSKYAADLHGRFISSQRDAMFRLISQIEPPLRAEQIEKAAKAANLKLERKDSSLHIIGGVEFLVDGDVIKSVKSSNF